MLTKAKLFYELLGVRLYFGFIFVVVSGLFETVGLILIVPLLQLIIDPTASLEHAPNQKIQTYIADFFNLIGVSLSINSVLALIIISFVIKGIFTFAAHVFIARLKSDLVTLIKTNGIDLISKANFEYIHTKNTGHFTNILNEQANRSVISLNQLFLAISQTITTIFYFIGAFTLSSIFGVYVLASGLFIYLLFRTVNRKVRIESNDFATKTGNLQNSLNDFIRNQKFFRASNSGESLKELTRRKALVLGTIQFKLGVFSALTHSIKEPLALSIVCILIIMANVSGNLDLSTAFVSLLLFYRGLNSTLATQSYYQECSNYIGSIEIVKNELTALDKQQMISREVSPVPDSWSNLQLRNTYYRYSDGRFGIKNISLVIQRNKKIGIIGTSGSGKTTLVDLICGIFPSNITLDGHSIYNRRQWNDKVGYVGQDTSLIQGTIKQNITLQFNDEPVDEELLIDVIKQSELTDLLDNLASGLNADVGESGNLLSGGQKQRILIARALYKQPEILIFDEATSALDTQTEEAFVRNLDKLSGKYTIIIIAHRMRTIEGCDEIVVMKDGEVYSKGNYADMKNYIDQNISNDLL